MFPMFPPSGPASSLGRRALAQLRVLFVLALAGCGGADGELEPPGGGRQGLVVLPQEGAPDPRPYYHSFGEVREGEVVRHVFRLRNTDPRPVAIRSIRPGCGCTVASVRYVTDEGEIVAGSADPDEEPRIVVPPGALAELELTVDTREISARNQGKLLPVHLATDSPNGYYLTLELHLVVERPLAVVPDALRLGRVPVGAGGSASVEIVAQPGFDERVAAVEEAPEGVRVELDHELRLGRDVWTLTATLEPPVPLGPVSAPIVLATRRGSAGASEPEEALDPGEPGEPGQPLVVEVLATGVPDVSAEPARIVFRAPADAPAEGRATVRTRLPGHRLRARGARLPEEHTELLSASLAPVEADGGGASPAWELSLRTRPPLPRQVLSGEVEVLFEDPQHPRVAVPYVVHPAAPR